TTNSRGYRTREYDSSPWTGVTRIVCVGDSVMFGYRINQEFCLTAVAEEAMNQNGSAQFEILNLAVPGYTTFPMLKQIQHQVVGLKPAAVIIGIGFSQGINSDEADEGFAQRLALSLKPVGLRPALYDLVRSWFGRSEHPRTEGLPSPTLRVAPALARQHLSKM